MSYDIKKLQACELEMMVEVDRICRKHNIQYFLSSGTMLGAIRHKGFIPWDDDLDVMMKMNEYRKFLKIAQSELGDKYFVQNCDTDYWYVPNTKIRMRGTTAIEEKYLDLDFNQEIWIDIFPICGVKNDKKWLDRRTKILNIRSVFLQDGFVRRMKNSHPSGAKEKLKIIIRLGITKILPLKFRRSIVRRIDNCLYKDPAGYEYSYLGWKSVFDVKCKTDVFDETVDVDFEGHKFMAPKKWDEYLTMSYGDYMTPPPPDQRSWHTIAIVDFDKEYTYYM